MNKHYTLADGSTIIVVRKARKRYLCPSVWAHNPEILPGEIYARVKTTPGMGRGWLDATYHIECAQDA